MNQNADISLSSTNELGGSEGKNFERGKKVRGAVRLNFSEIMARGYPSAGLAMVFSHEMFHATHNVSDTAVIPSLGTDVIRTTLLTTVDFENIIRLQLAPSTTPLRLSQDINLYVERNFSLTEIPVGGQAQPYGESLKEYLWNGGPLAPRGGTLAEAIFSGYAFSGWSLPERREIYGKILAEYADISSFTDEWQGRAQISITTQLIPVGFGTAFPGVMRVLEKVILTK